jgi:hypothetical protein
MPKHLPLTDPQGEVHELKTADLQRFKRVAALSPSLQSKLGVLAPQKAPTWIDRGQKPIETAERDWSSRDRHRSA